MSNITKILIDKVTVEQVLKALKRMKGYGNTFGYRSSEQNPYDQVCEAIAAIEALAEQPPKVVDCHATGVCVQSGLRAEQPAQRNPLTLAEVDEAYFARKDGASLYGCFLAGVRHAEAAHDIKENT